MKLLAFACAACGAANKILSRFCCECGTPLDPGNWSSRLGGRTENLPAELPRPNVRWRLNWSHTAATERTRAVLSFAGALITAAEDGSCQLWGPEGQPVATWRPAPGQHLLCYPCIVQGLLLLPLSNGLQAVDVLDWSGVSPPVARRTLCQPLEGTPLSHLAEDGKLNFGVVTEERGRVRVATGSCGPAGLDWLCSIAVQQEAEPQGPWGCCWSAGKLWICSPAGSVWSFDGERGQLVDSWDLKHRLQADTLQAKGERIVVAAESQQIFSYNAQDNRWTSFWLTDTPVIFALGVTQHAALVISAHRHLWLDLDSGLSRSFELPDRVVAPPMVGESGAFLVSYTGTLYAVNVTDRGPIVSSSLRVESAVNGCVLPPLRLDQQVILVGNHGEIAAVHASERTAPGQTNPSGDNLGDELDRELSA